MCGFSVRLLLPTERDGRYMRSWQWEMDVHHLSFYVAFILSVSMVAESTAPVSWPISLQAAARLARPCPCAAVIVGRPTVGLVQCRTHYSKIHQATYVCMHLRSKICLIYIYIGLYSIYYFFITRILNADYRAPKPKLKKVTGISWSC